MTLTDAEQERRKAAAAIFSAAAEGKVIEWLRREAWEVCDPFNIRTNRNVINYPQFYRIQPAPVVRPWRFEEAPLILRVKHKNGSYPAVAVLVPNGYWVHWEVLPDRTNPPQFFDFTLSESCFTQLDGQPCGQTPA